LLRHPQVLRVILVYPCLGSEKLKMPSFRGVDALPAVAG